MAGKPEVPEAPAAATLAVVPTNPFIALPPWDFPLLYGGHARAAKHILVHSGHQLGQWEAGVVADTFGVLFSITSGSVARGVKTLPIALMAPAIRRSWYAL